MADFATAGLAGAGLVWAVCGVAISRKPAHALSGLARAGLVLTGVPLAGYATLCHGPMVGIIALLVAAGVLAVALSPQDINR